MMVSSQALHDHTKALRWGEGTRSVDFVIYFFPGYFPIKLEALPEGTCINARVPVYQVWRRPLQVWQSANLNNPYVVELKEWPADHINRRVCSAVHLPGDTSDDGVVSFSASAMVQFNVISGPLHEIWRSLTCLAKSNKVHEHIKVNRVVCRYPTTVATLSRRARDVLEAAFEQSVEGGAASPLLPSRLHDFGFRGCCTVEQSVLGGTAHLLNFDGTDTLSAAYYAQACCRPTNPICHLPNLPMSKLVVCIPSSSVI